MVATRTSTAKKQRPCRTAKPPNTTGAQKWPSATWSGCGTRRWPPSSHPPAPPRAPRQSCGGTPAARALTGPAPPWLSCCRPAHGDGNANQSLPRRATPDVTGAVSTEPPAAGIAAQRCAVSPPQVSIGRGKRLRFHDVTAFRLCCWSAVGPFPAKSGGFFQFQRRLTQMSACLKSPSRWWCLARVWFGWCGGMPWSGASRPRSAAAIDLGERTGQ